MKILNLTPHAVTIRCGNYHIDLPVDGPAAARLTVEREELPSLSLDRTPINRMGDEEDGLFQCAIVRAKLGEPMDLPEQQAGVLVLVSAHVAEHPSLAHRTDLVYPGEPFRDKVGRITAANGLCAGLGLSASLLHRHHGGGCECYGCLTGDTSLLDHNS